MQKLFISKVLRRPIQKIFNIVQTQYAKHSSNSHNYLNKTYGYEIDNCVQLIYSAHDTTIGLALAYLFPNFNYTDVPYSSIF